MTNPTLPEMSRKVYEAMEWNKFVNQLLNDSAWYKDWRSFLFLGDIIQWIDANRLKRYIDYADEPMNPFDLTILYRPKDHLSQPIPLEPDESRRPLLEFLYSFIKQCPD